jgi:NAD(P)-dependent dehydrogenase (short-subunit alcohol dehydrogenase family)
MNRLKNKVALITGGASGIGRGIVDLFTAEGARIAILDIQPEWTRDTETELRGKGFPILGVHGDVSQVKDVQGAVQRCVREWGRVDILVNNAGTTVKGAPSLTELLESEWDRVMAVNVKGPLLCIQAVAPLMKAAGGGSIINISSISARSCYPRRGPYSMSKSALDNLTLQAAVELGPDKIRVNSISPGWFRTRMNEAVYQAAGELARRHATIPLARIGAVEDVARLALFLASEESDYISGESIEIDGGLLAAALKSSADLARLRPAPQSSES